jgi:hypothetical protein
MEECIHQRTKDEACEQCGIPRLSARLSYYEGNWWCEECLKELSRNPRE